MENLAKFLDIGATLLTLNPNSASADGILEKLAEADEG